MSWQFWLLPHCLRLRRPAGRRSSKVHHPHQRRPPMLLSRLLRGTLSVPLCRQRPGAPRSEQARLAVEQSRSKSIEPPGAQPRLRRKSARLRTVGGSGAYLCAATPMVPAAGAVSLAVPADAVVSATDVVPTTRVVVASPPPNADRRYSASFGRRGN